MQSSFGESFREGADTVSTLGGNLTKAVEARKKTKSEQSQESALTTFFETMKKKANLTPEQISSIDSAAQLAIGMVKGGSKIEEALKAANVLASGDFSKLDDSQRNQAINYVDPDTGQTMIGTYNPVTNEFKDINGKKLSGKVARGYSPIVKENPTTGKLDRFNPTTGKLEPLAGQEGTPIKTLQESQYAANAEAAKLGLSQAAENVINIPDKGLSIKEGILVGLGNPILMRGAISMGQASESSMDLMQGLNLFKQNYLFGDAGKALTGIEKNVILANINPAGKNKKQIAKDFKTAEIKFNTALKRNGQPPIDFGLSELIEKVSNGNEKKTKSGITFSYSKLGE